LEIASGCALTKLGKRKIIIENQLESTNHEHLGKIITYASGIDAEIIIWIVKDARDEHLQAINWLNEHTDEKIRFFLISGNNKYTFIQNFYQYKNRKSKTIIIN